MIVDANIDATLDAIDVDNTLRRLSLVIEQLRAELWEQEAPAQ